MYFFGLGKLWSFSTSYLPSVCFGGVFPGCIETHHQQNKDRKLKEESSTQKKDKVGEVQREIEWCEEKKKRTKENLRGIRRLRNQSYGLEDIAGSAQRSEQVLNGVRSHLALCGFCFSCPGVCGGCRASMG